MAGGLLGSKDPKKIQLIKNSSEVLKDSQDYAPSPKTPSKLSFKGVLGLGQTIEFNKPAPKGPEFFGSLSHINQEVNVLYTNHQNEKEQALKELREAIVNLLSTVSNIEKDVEAIILNETPEVNDYQVNFFVRLKNKIIEITQNISEPAIWVQSFAAKAKKKNYYWNKSKDKKKGGNNFMFSDEHAVARSVG